MKRHNMPDVLSRFPGGEDEPTTDPGTPETTTEGSGEGTGSEEDDDD